MAGGVGERSCRSSALISFETELFHAADQGGAGDAEEARRLGLVASRVRQGTNKLFALEAIALAAQARRRRADRLDAGPRRGVIFAAALEELCRHVLQGQRVAVTDDDGPFDDVF